MKTNKVSRNPSSYLDVSEFIIREPSPLIKPSSPPLPVSLESSNLMYTPEIGPIDHDPTQFFLTPINKTLLSDELVGDFLLDQYKGSPHQKKETNRKKKSRRDQPSEGYYHHLFKIQNGLDELFSESEMSLSVIEESDDSEQASDDENEDIVISEVRKKSTREDSEKGNLDERQSTIDLSQVDYTDIIQKFSLNPKEEMLKSMKEIQARKDIEDQDQKKVIMKEVLGKYLVEYQMHCYEESWINQMNDKLSSIVEEIAVQLQETFNKRIGLASFQERRLKLLKYLQKKKRRIWRKKVSYDCRKKVADGRLRIKGKFVTREQACEQLGLKSLENYSAEEIKELLQHRIDFSLSQSVEG